MKPVAEHASILEKRNGEISGSGLGSCVVRNLVRTGFFWRAGRVWYLTFSTQNKACFIFLVVKMSKDS